jgi:hypothetical protein
VKYVISAVSVAILVTLQAGCSEPSQGVEYQDGRYAGKPDTPNWQSDAFDNNRDTWEREIQRRNRLQSEYTRPGGA